MPAVSGNDLSASPVTLNAAFLMINIPSSSEQLQGRMLIYYGVPLVVDVGYKLYISKEFISAGLSSRRATSFAPTRPLTFTSRHLSRRLPRP